MSKSTLKVFDQTLTSFHPSIGAQLVKVQVERVNPVPTPVRLRLLCNLTGEGHEDFRPFSSWEYQAIATDIPAPSVN